MEHVVAHREIVQQAERWQYDAIPHRECQSHLFTCKTRQKLVKFAFILISLSCHLLLSIGGLMSGLGLT